MSQHFRELTPVELWSGCIQTTVDAPLFAQVLHRVSQEQRFTFFGFLVANTVSSTGNEYHFTRYPRRKYGIATIEACQRALGRLGDLLSRYDTGVAAQVETEQLASTGVTARVLLGLVEGYGSENHQHALTEVVEHLGTEFAVRPAQIFTRGPEKMYQEPAALILAKELGLPAVYDLAYQFAQQRFTVERFDQGQAWVVETPHVTQPDAE